MKVDERDARDLRERTKRFALKIIQFYGVLPPRNHEAEIIGKQLLRSGISAGANYREASRARSHSEFIAKLGIVIQELDETAYWLELLLDAKINTSSELAGLMTETNELIAIFTTIVKKVRRTL